jgi:pimeloyl-ACP methyl ester carboxylesterase
VPERRLFIPLLLVASLSTAGCAGSRQEVYSPPPCVLGCRGIILVADGAGNFQAASTSLRQVAARQQVPLEVRTFDWSHGYPRVLADHVDYAHARSEGQRLAAEVALLRQECPGTEIYLVGHSAGCGVVLAAAEALPCGYVDRIVLLSPSVSVCYDLRPALRSVRETVDAFYSENDWLYLALFTRIVGTSDRHWSAASGRFGFQPQVCTPEDALLYTRLRQFPWQPALVTTGNLGGHYGAYQPAFLRQYVLPLFERQCVAAAPP